MAILTDPGTPLQPSVPLQIAQQILDQPVQPMADPATLQAAQDQQAQAQQQSSLTSFFQQTFSALHDQEQQRQADQAAMQDQAAQMPAAIDASGQLPVIPDQSEQQQPVDTAATSPAVYDPNAGLPVPVAASQVTPVVSNTGFGSTKPLVVPEAQTAPASAPAAPSAAVSPELGAIEQATGGQPGGISTDYSTLQIPSDATADDKKQILAYVRAQGLTAKSQPEKEYFDNAFGRLAQEHPTAARDAVLYLQNKENVQGAGPFASMSPLVSATLGLGGAGALLGTAGVAGPVASIVAPEVVNKIAAPLPAPVRIPAEIAGQVAAGALGGRVGAAGAAPGIPEMVAAPLEPGLTTRQRIEAAVPLAFFAVPVLGPRLLDAARTSGVPVEEFAASPEAQKIVSDTVAEHPEITATLPNTTSASGAIPEIQMTRAGARAGNGLDDVQQLIAEARSITDPAERQRFMEQHGVASTHEQAAIDRGQITVPETSAAAPTVPVQTESTSPVQITERPQTPDDITKDRHVLVTPDGGIIDYRGTHINDVNAGPVQGQGVGSALVTQAVQQIRSEHPDAVITADLNTEGGVRVMAKQPGVQFTDVRGNPISFDEAVAAANKFEGPKAEISPTPVISVPAAPAVAEPSVAPATEQAVRGSQEAPTAAPTTLPSPAEASRSAAPEPPTPATLPAPAEANPIAAAAGVQTPAAKVRTGNTSRRISAISGGAKILPDVPSISRLESSMQRSKTLNNVIRRVPQIGSVARVLFGPAADTSDETRALAAAHGALRMAYDNRAEVGMAHVVHDAPIREAFGKPKFSDVRNNPDARQFHVTVKDAQGNKQSIPITDILEGDLAKFNLNPKQREAIVLRRQVWQDAVSKYNNVVKQLKKSKFRIRGLNEAVDGLEGDQSFPRQVIGRVDAEGKLHTDVLDDTFGNGSTGSVKTSASFKAGRAGIDLYETPDGTRIEVPNGARVVKSDNGYQILTKKDLDALKEEAPGTKPPKAVELTRVHQLPTGEFAAIPKDTNLYELPDGTRLNMSVSDARAFRKGLPKDQWPTKIETIPYTRTFTVAENEARGLRYEDPDVTLSKKLSEIGKRTADLELLNETLKRNKDVLKTREQILGRNPKTGVLFQAPAEKFGGTPGDVIDVRSFDAGKFPALKDYYGPKELVQQYERLFGPDTQQLFKPASELSSAGRSLIASGDIGTVGIQLMGAIANDMGNLTRAAYRAATGRPALAQRTLSNITGHALMAKVHTALEGEGFLSRTLADPANAQVLERWGDKLNPPHQTEFVAQNAGAHGFGKLPVVGSGFVRLQQMFENSLFIAQLEQAKAYDRIFPGMTDAQRESLGSWTRNSVGTLSMRRLGVSPLQQDIESTYGLFASRYTRSLFAFAGALMKGGIEGEQARLALGSLFAAGAVAYIGAATALGQKPEFDPTKPGFMSIRVGNNWVGIGGGVKTMAHLIATTGDTLFTQPQNFLSPDFNGPRENPLLNFWRSRTSPLTGTAIDLFTGEDFRGHPIHMATDWPSLLISHTIPFAGQGALEANGNFFTKAGMGLVTGLGYRASPMTAYQLYDTYLKDQRNAVTGEQRFPDGAATTETATNGYDQFVANDAQAAHLKAALDASRRSGTQQQQDIQGILDDRNKRLDAAQQQFNTTHDYLTFRQQDSAIRGASSDAMRQLALGSVSSTADKAVLNSWFDTYNDPRAVDPVTGGINSDGLDQAQAEWQQQHPGEYDRVVAPNLKQGETPLETQLRTDRQTIAALGWWNTDKTAWNTLVARARANGINIPGSSSEADYIQARTQQLIAKAQAQGIPQPELAAQEAMSSDRVLQAFDTIRTDDRLVLQRQHPELTILLARWGYNGVSQEEYDMAVHQLAAQGKAQRQIY